MSVLSVLLFPFSMIFWLATGIRNHLYSIGHKKSFRFEVPVINVGNLNIGGSGKTPAIEYLIRLLKSDYKIATLSRGYGRRTRGLRFATEQDTATTLGDEPFQFYRNFGAEVNVVVGEDRAFAIPNILHEHPETSVVLLDDAYQHRRVNPHFNILLTDYEKPFFADYLLPMGRLRESRSGVSRADAIVVTKCRRSLSGSEEKKIIENITAYAGNKPVFFSSIKYGRPVSFQDTRSEITSRVILLTGIAKPQPLVEYVGGNFELIKHFQFRDHHLYTIKDITNLKNFVNALQEPVSILTTEKDMVKLMDRRFNSLLSDLHCFFIPIEMEFLKNGAEFDDLVLRAIENGKAETISTNL